MKFIQNFTHAFFFFPGTFLHEFLHLFAALISIAIGKVFNLLSRPFHIGAISTLRITSFNILPNFKTGVYGSVTYEGGGSFTHIFVSSAPKFAWIFLYLFLQSFGFMFVDQNSLAGEQSLTFHWGHLGTAQLLIGIYASLQLLWAGTLSRQDWSNIFSAFGNIFAVALMIAVIVYMAMSISGVPQMLSAAWNAMSGSTELASSLIENGSN